MRKRDTKNLEVGDTVFLKHHLGDGDITEIAHEPRVSLPGRYPMIRYLDSVTGNEVWCTHRVIEKVTKHLRSV